MNKYRYYGQINPRDIIKFDNFVYTSDLKGIDSHHSGNLKIKIDNNTVEAIIETESNFDEDLETLKNTLEYLVGGIINTANYFYGYAVDVVLESGGNISKEIYTFPPRIRFLKESDRSLPILDLLSFVMKTPALHRAINDLKSAIKNPMDVGFYCFRAIEAIRQNFLEDNEEDTDKAKKKSWEQMNEKLKINKTYYSKINDNANITRHGKVTSVAGSDMEEILIKAWTVVDRFIMHLNKGKLDEKLTVLE